MFVSVKVSIKINKTLKKHSSAIQIAGDLSALQRKSYNIFLYYAKKHGKNYVNDSFEINIDDFKSELDIKSKDSNSIEKIFSGLLSYKVEYNFLKKDKNKVWGIFHLLSEIEVDTAKNRIRFNFPKKLKEILLNPDMYTELDLYVIKGLKSKYSIVLYELLKDFKKEGKDPILEMARLRTLLGIEESKYSMMSMLRLRVLDKAKDEINKKTDLKIDYELIRSGKKFEKIKYTVHEKTNNFV